MESGSKPKQQKHLSKFTQNYPTERKDYPDDNRHQEKSRDPAEGGLNTVDEAIRNQPTKKPKAA